MVKKVERGFTSESKTELQDLRQSVAMSRIIKPEYVERLHIARDGIEELAENIKTNGLINALTVKEKGNRFEIVAGHRRYLALRMLGALKVSVVVVTGKQLDVEMIKLSENLVREDLNDIEEAKMLSRLKKIGKLDDKKLAAKIGKSEGYVRQKINILKYPVEILEALQARKITFSVSRELIRIKNDDLRREYLKHAINGGATPALVHQWVDEILHQEKLAKGLEDDGYKGNPNPQVPTPKFICYLCEQETDLTRSQLYRIDHSCVKKIEEGG